MKKAVIKVGGKQFIVSEKETLLVDLLPQGTKELKLDALMLIDGDKVEVGTPFVKGVKVSAKVVDELVRKYLPTQEVFFIAIFKNCAT